jgi:aerobic-type carbon monoxide dehydrogenase small subunit (CoxS/CutS family)
MNTTQICLNGQEQTVNAPDNTPLLYVIRNDLDHKGTRFGCGSGNCGACTVIVDGQAVQSCDMQLWAAANKDILTPEGLARDPIGQMVQSAFIQEQAAQCGYCINGILMSVTALLQKTTHPSKEQLMEALNRHLCRCGTHVRILRAIDTVIEQLNEKRAA